MTEKEIPQDLKYAAIQSSLDHMKAQFSKHEEFTKRFEEMDKNYKKEISDLLGSKANEYSMFYKKRAELARIMAPKFTATPEGENAERDFKKTRLAEADEFFKSLGKVNDIQSIRKKYSEEVKSLSKKFRKFENKD